MPVQRAGLPGLGCPRCWLACFLVSDVLGSLLCAVEVCFDVTCRVRGAGLPVFLVSDLPICLFCGSEIIFCLFCGVRGAGLHVLWC